MTGSEKVQGDGNPISRANDTSLDNLNTRHFMPGSGEFSTTRAVGPETGLGYGTSGQIYKLWVDYIYDWFDATLDRPVRMCLVSAGFVGVFFCVDIIICWASGLIHLYFNSLGVYIVSFGSVGL